MSRIDELLKSKSGIRLDIGCGENKAGPDWVGMDSRHVNGVDIVWDVTRFPWPLPDECALVAVTSHLVEHIPPDAGDNRVTGLINLLIEKEILSEEEVQDYIGEIETGPRFIAFMNEVWRILKPGGEFLISCPHGYSPGFLQDPTHINEVSEATFAYFDPLHPEIGNRLYCIYRPMPWQIKPGYLFWNPSGNIEVVLVKRRIDKSYNTIVPLYQLQSAEIQYTNGDKEPTSP